jgi:hypothetical protein
VVSGSGRVAALDVGATYVVIASLPVLLPVAVYVIVGDRASTWVEVSKGWLIANRLEVTFYLALVFGLVFAVVGLVGLVS